MTGVTWIGRGLLGLVGLGLVLVTGCVRETAEGPADRGGGARFAELLAGDSGSGAVGGQDLPSVIWSCWR